MLQFSTEAEQRKHYLAVTRRLMTNPRPIAKPTPPKDPPPILRNTISAAEIDRLMRDLAQALYPPTVGNIIAVVCDHYGVTLLDIESRTRTSAIVRARHVAMYLARTLTDRSLPQIGKKMGGRDHTTALHGARKIAALIGIPLAGDPEPPPPFLDERLIGDIEAIKLNLSMKYKIPGVAQ